MEMITDFFNKIFAAIDSPDSIAFLTFIALFFLLGFILAAILYGRRARRRRKELEKLQKDYKDLQLEHERLQEQIDLKQADLIRAEREAEDAMTRLRNIEREKENLNIEILTLTDENANLKQQNGTYASNIEALNNQIIGLNTRNTQLASSAEHEGEAMNQLMDMQSSYQATVNRLAALENKLETYTGENETLRKELDGVKTNTGGLSLTDLEVKLDKLSKENEALQTSLKEAKDSSVPAPIAELEAKIRNILDDNAALHKELDSLKSSTEALSFAAIDTSGSRNIGDKEVKTETAEEAPQVDKAAKTEAAKNAVKGAIGGKIAIATREEKDDLTVIKGIGNFIEQKLNGLGIYTFNQISQFDKDLIEEVTSAIEFFPGRIERDDWVGQATRLLEIKKTNPEVLEKSIYPDNAEDLTVVEGIGPKLAQLLKNSGISNWSDLAKTDVKKLKTILEVGGKKYNAHDPSTWPMQAQMAADAKWTELKDYQDYLVGGKEE